MTVHSAKGLEFDSIYVTGLEENLFPSLMSVGDIRDLEEERRLFYVAVTRAKSNLTLSYAHNRYKWGNLEDCKPSRFLAEIDEQFIEYPQNERGFTSNKDTAYERSHMRGNTTDSKGRAYYRGRNQRAEEKKASDIVPPSRNFKKLATTGPSDNAGSGSLVDPDSLRAGTEVMHERFGKGMIKKIEGSAPNTTALVDFELSGERKLLLRFAKLRLVEK